MKQKSNNVFIFIFIAITALLIILSVKDKYEQPALQTIDNQTIDENNPLIIEEYYNLREYKKDLWAKKIMDNSSPTLTEKVRSLWKAVDKKDSYNNELQYYSISNVLLSEGFIQIISKKAAKDDKLYTSGLVQSVKAYQFGYFEFEIQISQGKGIFPAIWFLPQAGDALPELDVFEMIGDEPDIFYGVIHYEENGTQRRDYFQKKVAIKDTYKIALDWQPNLLTWYIDNEKIYQTDKGVPKEYMYIIINQAIGGNWPGNPDNNTVFPSNFIIKHANILSVSEKERE